MRSAKKFLLAASFLSCILLSPCAEGVQYIEPPRCYTIKPGRASRTIGVQEEVLLHTSIYNRSAKKNYYLKGQEFEVWLKDGKLRASDFRVINVEANEESIRVILVHPERPLEVELHYEGKPDSFYVHKWLKIMPLEGEGVFVDRIVLENFEAGGRARSFFGPGQPVYFDDCFFGVEYPSAENEIRDGRVFCSYLVGLDVGGEGLVSKRSVYGAAESGMVRYRFLEYVDEIRARKVRPFLLYNTWYDLRNYGADEVIASIRGFRREFNEPYGVEFDSIILDDGWDRPLDCWRPHPRRFPEGFAPVREEANRSGAGLGIWMSPLGGYPWRQWIRIMGSAGEGYEKSPLGFCIAGPTYHEWFRDRMLTFIREHDVNYFKLDNLTRVCENPEHGHRTGRYGQAGLTDAFIEILDAVRAEAPDVMLNITVGAWLSPWWLMHADVVWIGGLDYSFAGEGSVRQQSISYRDRIMFRRFREEGAQFPLDSVMTHGIIKARLQKLGDRGENLGDFQDDCMMYFGRGVMMWELYLSPDALSGREWEFLAQTIKWADENQRLLSRSRMVLGDPGKDEVYGYWHELGDEAMIFMRNPDAVDREAELVWSELIEKKNMEAEIREVLYPREEKPSLKNIPGGVQVSLKPFQTLALSFKLDSLP